MGKKQLATTARTQFEIEGEGDGETVVLTVDVKRKGQWVRIAKQLQRPEPAQPGTGLHRARSEPGPIPAPWTSNTSQPTQGRNRGR
jgi:hypothetical protein